MTIKLSEHRRRFRIGGQAVDVWVDHVMSEMVRHPITTIVVDEDLAPELEEDLANWYFGCGARLVSWERPKQRVTVQ